MKNSLLLAVCIWIAFTGFVYSQNFWTPKSMSEVRTQTLGRNQASVASEIMGLDLAAFKKALAQAPQRENTSGKAALILAFPNAEGKLENFSVVAASTLHPALAARYPEIQSYAGQGLDDPSAVIRFSVSQLGVHGMIMSGEKGSYFIDPYTTDLQTYTIYARKDLTQTSDFTCLTKQGTGKSLQPTGSSTERTNDKKLRKYRLAMSCTAEYGNLFAGTGTDAQKKANILAQMNVTMTRVNGVYEKDLAITMEIVPNNLSIIYFGSTTTDPWSGEYNTKTQQVIDAAIGNANYDIGHNFNTSGGGDAGCIGCVCTTGSKGSGYTGQANPTGDAFDIDYVAHEIGHQFGGYHTMNTCSRSGNGSTEVEPASGSTIMSYAGICSSNVQSNSDDYFAYVNIRDISANIQSGVSSGCAQIVSIANNPPTANAGLDYTIPKSTPFVLRGQGSDPDGDVLTYTWEQNDPARAPGSAAPLSTWTVGPMFRSLKGTTSPDRYFPALSTVLAGSLSSTWEVLPSVARTLNFSLVVRDNKAGGGQTADDLMKVTVAGTAGPFVVSAPNTALSWAIGSSQTVTWDVAGTTATPVSCANVNILLSTDGGLTYPITLLANTPNDGSQAITVPNNASTTCRVKVEAVDNIFYDISNANFTISGGSPICTANVPTGLAASAITGTTAKITWNAVSGATYVLQYRVRGTSTWTSLPVNSMSVTLTGLSRSTNYSIRISSVCPPGISSGYSSNVRFTTTSSATRIATASVSGAIEIYPNPVENYLQFSVPTGSLKGVKVYSISGSELKNVVLQADGIDVSKLKAGMYMISIQTTDGSMIRKKFIKQ